MKQSPEKKETAEQAEASLSTNYVVRAIGVKKVYTMGAEKVHALRGVDFAVRRGEYISIMGPSGSGKSTLFNMIGGLDKPNEGQVYIDEVDIAALNPVELAWLRCHKVGYIFQTYNLITVATALDNVMLPMTFAGMQQADAQDKAIKILERVGLGERVLHKPLQMSGGQQQRVAIARALANSPSIILADEPTANLDKKTGLQIINLLKELNMTEGVSIITATHDHKMLDISDRIAWVRDGQIEKFQKRSELEIKEGEMHVQ
ncbi:MAG TPA: ABC transporter [Lentisphaeria bacterium]|nr:MAG: ABC transporter [Lentisphaerae bacterium GWF2_49_21]HBC88458.1 ABC transporter [Lentisphaeria bacterium]